MGMLTTHILDTAQGGPAAGIPIALYRVDQPEAALTSCYSNEEGRADSLLLSGSAFLVGEYELVFHVASYFRNAGLVLADPPFFDRIAIRFSIADAAAHYHVPLLVSPWSYSTYRGS